MDGLVDKSHLTMHSLRRCVCGCTWRPTGPLEDEHGRLWPAVTSCPACASGASIGHGRKGDDYWREKAAEAEVLLAQGIRLSEVCRRLRVGRRGLEAAMQRLKGEEE